MNHARYVDRNYSGQRSWDGSDAPDARGAPDAPDAAIRRLAERQHGIVTCGQHRGLGLTQHAIAYRLRVGRLRAVRRAVYAVGHRQATTEARWMAAVLAGGPEAVLSHHSAGERWGVIEGARTPVDLTVPRPRRPARGIRYHRSVLARDEATRSDGIPVTSFPRTLFDLATVLRPRQLERALNEGEIRRHWDTLSLEELLVRYPRRHGSRAIRGLGIAALGMRITRNEFEVRLLELVDAAGLPEPQPTSPSKGSRWTASGASTG